MARRRGRLASHLPGLFLKIIIPGFFGFCVGDNVYVVNGQIFGFLDAVSGQIYGSPASYTGVATCEVAIACYHDTVPQFIKMRKGYALAFIIYI